MIITTHTGLGSTATAYNNSSPSIYFVKILGSYNHLVFVSQEQDEEGDDDDDEGDFDPKVSMKSCLFFFFFFFLLI